MPRVFEAMPGWYVRQMCGQPRRSRMRRTRTGKRLEITARDIEIFRLLRRYRYLRSSYIHAFVGGASETRFKERLGDLFHEGFIDRPAQQWELANCRHVPVVYESGKGGERILRERGIEDVEPVTFLAGTARRQFLHSLMICEILASLELGIRLRPDLRFIAWPEILARAPEKTRALAMPFRIPVPSGGYIVPDGLFGIEYTVREKKSYRFFALEADRNTMPVDRSNSGQTSYLGKIAAYSEIISQRVHKVYLGLPNFIILSITTNRIHMQQIVDRLQGKREKAAFLFSTRDSVRFTTPTPQFLLRPWKRAGLSSLCIADASIQLWDKHICQ